MKPPFVIEWKLVTPQLAAEWLKKNTNNRNLRESTVLTFARDMVRGAWSENHQAIAFDKNGNLIDGQQMPRPPKPGQRSGTVDRGNTRSDFGLVSKFKAGESMEALSKRYCLTLNRIEQAIRSGLTTKPLL